MGTLTEIIPEDMPEWAKDAMDRGQFFNEACKRVNADELTLAVALYEFRIKALMDDVEHGDLGINDINDRLINLLRDAN